MSKSSDFNNNQYLSDLLDGCVSKEGMQALLPEGEEIDREQEEAWYRYNTVRAVLNKENSAYSSFEFTQSISAKIAQEPSIVARSKVNKLALADGSESSVHYIDTWKKMTGGFAIAASVALAMIFSVELTHNNMNTEGTGGLQTVATEPAMSPEVLPVTFIDDAEQAKLDEIQAILDRMNRQNLTQNEQLVGGEVMVKSFVVKMDEKASAFENEVRQMKKPSESIKPQ